MLIPTLILGLVLYFSGILTKVFYKYVNKIVEYVLFLIPFGALVYGSCCDVISIEFLICALVIFFTTPFVLVKMGFFKDTE